MYFLHEPVPKHATQPMWEPELQVHEFLFSAHVFAAHEAGIKLDFHLPWSTSTVTEVDAVLGKYLQHLTAETTVDELPTPLLAHENDKWRAFSGMQKAIRRSNPLMAWRCCIALIQGGQSQPMWRRLLITALEDVGLGDPYTVALVAKATCNKKFRDSIGDRKVLWCLINLLCTAPKSRDLCDLVVYCFLPGQVDDEFKHLIHMKESTLLEYASNPQAAFLGRMLAHWRAWGPKFGCTPHGNPKLDNAIQANDVYDAIGLPPLFRHISFYGYRGTGEALVIPIPFLWQMMCASSTAGVGKDPYETGENLMIGNLYSATFDKHTWDGKRALRQFLSKNTHFRQYLLKSGIPEAAHFAALERAVFYVEGAILRPRLTFDGADRIYHEILKAKMLSNGFKNEFDGCAFYEVVQDKIEQLHKLRLAS